jgi:hypothetical protein
VSPSVDRFLLAALVDRLVSDTEATFAVSDALQLAQLLPREARASFFGRFFGAGIQADISGGSTRGHAAGVGDVEVRDDRPRTLRLSTGERGVVRAGQWKLRWAGRHVEIDQVADVGPMPRSARLVFNRDGTPRELVQLGYQKFGPLVIGTLRPWKRPS